VYLVFSPFEKPIRRYRQAIGESTRRHCMVYVDRNDWDELRGDPCRRPISGIYNKYLVGPTSKSDRRTGERSRLFL
jgi:hypothetical protein